MALAKNMAVFAVVMAALCGISLGNNSFRVGDSAGWIPASDSDYQKWASDKNFQAGDTLEFVYDPQRHNVMEVMEQEFDSCNPGTPIATYNSGSDRVPLANPGDHFFICSYHCANGMKLKVTVQGCGGAQQMPPPRGGSGGNPQFPPPQGGSGGDQQLPPPRGGAGTPPPTTCIDNRTHTYIPGCIPTVDGTPYTVKGAASVSSAWLSLSLAMLGVFAAAIV